MQEQSAHHKQILEMETENNHLEQDVNRYTRLVKEAEERCE